MHKRAFDAALRAALKITFSTTLLACGGTVDLDEDPPPDVEPGDPGTTASTAASSGSGADGGGTIAEPRPRRPEPRPEPRQPREQCETRLVPPIDWWTFDEHTFACCSQSVDAAIEASDIDTWHDAHLDDLATQNCCSQIIAPNQQALWSGQPLPHPAAEGVIEACCTLQTGTPTCMAWGPPMPPAMAAADWDAWLALEADLAPEGDLDLEADLGSIGMARVA